MAAAWLRFRGLRLGVQLVCWLLFFPLVAALAITRGQREPASRVVAGIVVLVVTVPIWLAAIFGANDPGDGEIAGPAPVEATQDVAPEAIPEPEPTPDAATEVEANSEQAVDETDANSDTGGEDVPLGQAPAL